MIMSGITTFNTRRGKVQKGERKPIMVDNKDYYNNMPGAFLTQCYVCYSKWEKPSSGCPVCHKSFNS